MFKIEPRLINRICIESDASREVAELMVALLFLAKLLRTDDKKAASRVSALCAIVTTSTADLAHIPHKRMVDILNICESAIASEVEAIDAKLSDAGRKWVEMQGRMMEKSYPCKYGHFNCSDTEGGKCSDEEHSALPESDRQKLDR